jgi:hypothetical protein
MLKRVTWLGAGLVTGFAASKWVERKARRRWARYFPDRRLPLRAGADIAGKARDLAVAKMSDLRSAVDEGRSAMIAREAELRRQLKLDERQWKLDEPTDQRNGGTGGAWARKRDSR